MMATPHTLVEGVIISSYAIRANHAFIYVPRRGAARRPPAAAGGRRRPTSPATSAPTSSAPATTSSSSCTPAPAPTSAARRRRCSTRSRAGAASRGCARRSRPSPACTPRPTVINNVESIASVPVDHRATAPTGSPRWAPRSRKGFRLFSLSGHVTSPGQYEAPLGITLRELLDLAGGVREGHELKFWTPGGSSTPILTAEHLDVPLDFEGVAARRLDARHHGRCRSSTRPPASSAPCCAGPSSTSTSRAASARPAARARGGCVQMLQRLEAGKGSEADLETAARPVRQHPRPVVLRARRRRGQPDHVVASSTSATSTSPAPHARRLPVRPAGRRPLFATAGVSRMTDHRARGGRPTPSKTGHADDRRRRGHACPRARW